MDNTIDDNQFKILIVSFKEDLQDPDNNNIESKLVNLGEKELPVFIDKLAKSIVYQIESLSSSSDADYFTTSVSLLSELIKNKENEQGNLITMSNCIKYALAAIDKLSYAALTQKDNYDANIIESLCLFIKDLIELYPQAREIMSKGILIKAVIDSFGQYRITRLIIYQIVENNNNLYSTLKEAIGKLLSCHINNLNNHDEIIEELIKIAYIFNQEFKYIQGDFYLVLHKLSYTIRNNDSDNQKLFNFFKELCILVFKEQEPQYVIINLLLQLYDDHITNIDLCLLLLKCFCQSFSSEQYILMRNKCDFIGKIINQFHKQNDCVIINYYLKWLQIQTTEFVTIDFSKEFHALCKSLINYNSDNSHILKAFLDRLKAIFSGRHDIGLTFLEQLGFFEYIDIIPKDIDNIKFDFIENLFKFCISPVILDQAAKTQLFNYDILANNDDLLYRKITIILSYETNPNKFYVKANDILKELKVLSYNILKENEYEYEIEALLFIDIFELLLHCLSKDLCNIVGLLDNKLFEDIRILLKEFTIVLLEREYEPSIVLKLWNVIFAFIYDYNMTIIKKKYCIKIGNKEKTPLIITKKQIRDFIDDSMIILEKLDKRENVAIILRYLYEKCIDYQSNEYKYEDDYSRVQYRLPSNDIECNDDISENENAIDNDIDSIIEDNNIDLMQEAVEKLKSKYKPIPSIKYNNIILQSQFILKSLLSVIFSKNNDKDYNISYKLSLISYMEFLCTANPINISLILQCGIIKLIYNQLKTNISLNTLSTNNNSLNDRLTSLFNILMPYINKKDLSYCFKQVYESLAIHQNNLTIPRNLFNIIEHNLPIASLNRNYITIASINTDNPSIYQFMLLPQVIVSPFNSIISLHTSSLESLSKFCLCYLRRLNYIFSIVFDNGSLIIYLNNKVRFTYALFAQNITNAMKDFSNKTIKKSMNQWYTFIIRTSGSNEVKFKKNYTVIDIEDILFDPNEKKLYKNDLYSYEGAYDFVIGFINCKKNKKKENINEKDITYTHQSIVTNNVFPYVDISYILISRDPINCDNFDEMNSNNIFSSKKGSATKLRSFQGKSIIAEILFNDINLEIDYNISIIYHKMKDYFRYRMNPIIPIIPCNDGIRNDKIMYLFKHQSLIHYAAMNHIYSLEALNKSLIKKKHLSFHAILDKTLSDVFFSDMFFIYLYTMNTDFFIPLYQLIFNIILMVDNLSSLFFSSYLPYLHLIFKPFTLLLTKDFAMMLIIHPIVVMSPLLSDECIINLYLHPYLFTSFSATMQLEIMKRISIFIQHNISSCQMTDNKYEPSSLILKKLIELLMHFELNENLIESTKDLIQIITEKAHNDTIEDIAYYNSLASQIYDGKIDNKDHNTTPLPGFEFLSLEIITKQIEILLKVLKEIEEQKELVIEKNKDKYIIEHFKLDYDYFQQNLIFEKKKRSLDKTLRLLWPDVFDNYSDYTWFLSDKEGHCRMRKKIVLKENDMNISKDILDKKIKSYSIYWTWIEKLALYEHHVSVPINEAMINKYEKHQATYICLLMKNNIKTESLLILSNKSIYIIPNVIIDSKQRIHLSKRSTSNHFWASNDINMTEWESLINVKQCKSDSVTRFNFHTTQIKIKTISYLQISEVHKRNYCHQHNSMEIFTLKGSSYFITVFPKLRDELFGRIINNINELSINSKVKNIAKCSSLTSVYMKHYPIIGMRTKKRSKYDFYKEKIVINARYFIDDTMDKWSQGLISNFNYLMLLNTLGGRSYNDLTQYFIFPWMLKNFFKTTLNLNDDECYRDFSYPLHAQIPSDRIRLKKKYSMDMEDARNGKAQFERRQTIKRKNGERINKNERCNQLPIMHSGHFYSHFSFVCYFLFRLNPYTSISFSVKETFSQGDRCFNSMEHLCSTTSNYHEWVPELFYLPEMLININDNKLGVMTVNHSQKREMNDITIPPWADSDPRTVSIILNKILESPKVSEALSNWIDLVFGYKLMGKDCIESLNLFNEYCYPYAYDDIRKISYQESDIMLMQTENMGCCATQLFFKSHMIKKTNQNVIPFYERHCFIGSMIATKDNSLSNIQFKGIGDMKGRYELPKDNVSNGEGGLSSLNVFIDQLNEDGFDKDIKARRPYMLVGKNKTLLGPKFTSVLSHSHTSIIISLPHYFLSFEYNLNEPSNITSIISSLNGKYIIVGFLNGNIIKYRKRTKRQSILISPYNTITTINQNKLPIKTNCNPSSQSKANLINSTYTYYPYSTINDFDYWKTVSNVKSSISLNLLSVNKQIKIHYLIEESRNGLSCNSIHLMDLCESYSFLLIVDDHDNIYQYDFNQFKMLYQFALHKVTSLKYTTQFIKIIHKTGDYLIGSKYSIHLFSINGLPIVEMNIFDLSPKLGLTSISSYEVVSVSDTIIFTGHSNGMMVIWKLKTDSYENNLELPLFQTFHQRYQQSFKEKTYKTTVKKRELDNIRIIHDSKSKIMYMKLSDDGMKLYYINQEKTVYYLSSDDYSKEKINKTIKQIAITTTMGICKNCKKTADDSNLNSSISQSGLCTECTDNKNISTSFSDRLIHDQ